jgi:short-subunit dehydrogenase
MTQSSATEKRRGIRPRALVTGASSGIGAAFATRLARDGYDLTLVARTRTRLEELATRLCADGGAVEVLVADLSDPRGVDATVAVVADAPLDLLVNNAGFGTVGTYADLDPIREEEEVRLNVIALMRLTRAALPAMVARRTGAIINVSSVAAFQPAPFNATYGATKAWVNSFTEAIAEELRDSGVRVQALCPGFTRTEFQSRAGIDVSSLPSFVWMSPEAVVDASLTALQRGDVVVVPGTGNKLATMVTAVVPRSVVRRISGTLGRRLKLGSAAS